MQNNLYVSSNGCALQALENAKSNDLLFWASRYNLFVLWSADRTHPWDSMPGAANHATLEIGKQRGSDSEVWLAPNDPLFGSLLSVTGGPTALPNNPHVARVALCLIPISACNKWNFPRTDRSATLKKL